MLESLFNKVVRPAALLKRDSDTGFRILLGFIEREY